MNDPIIPIDTIRTAAAAAAQAGKEECPAEFLFVEHVWFEAYRLAQYELRREVTA